MEALVRKENEVLILAYGKSAGGAELVETEWSFLRRKEISGVKSISMTVPKNVPVDFIGSTFQSDVDDGPASYSILNARIGLKVEFGDAVQWNQSRGSACDSSLPQGRFAVVTVVVRNTVDREIIRSGTLPIDIQGLKSAAGAALHARHSIEKIVKVAAIVGKLCDQLVVK